MAVVGKAGRHLPSSIVGRDEDDDNEDDEDNEDNDDDDNKNEWGVGGR